MSNLENNDAVKTIGFIINPIAGMGGAVGLKGTDGKIILNKAIALGAKPIAPTRAKSFLSKLEPIKEKIRLIVGAGTMGEDAALSCGLTCIALGKRKEVTTAEDTRQIAEEIAENGANLLVFCGGDGTARDIQRVITDGLPVLGVPTGVKMHSAVFALNPQAAASIVKKFLRGELSLKQVEIMDVDEKAVREGRVSSELYGYVMTPYEPYLIQGNKMASPTTETEMQNQAAIAIYIIEEMKPNVVYIVGPGTTTRTIGDLLDLRKTLLGVDLFYNKKIIASDVNEKQILEKTRGKSAQIIVTPIGGQGFIFGRGNQQISPKVIRQVGLERIMVIATKGKIKNLKSLRVDTGDSTLDAKLRRHGFNVIIDYKMENIMPVE